MPEDLNKTASEAEETFDESAADAADQAATAESAPGDEATDQVGELLRKLDEVSAEAQSRREDYLRAVAELDNYRKRALREKDEARLRATSAVLEDVLPVLDNFSLGLKAARQHEGGQAFAQGFAMVLSQFESLLRQHGVEELAPDGQPFDPNYHESVAHQPHDDVPEGHVIEVQRIGYRLRERLLRPAVVVVSSGPSAMGKASAEDDATTES